jgi:hypothetical protein
MKESLSLCYSPQQAAAVTVSLNPAGIAPPCVDCITAEAVVEQVTFGSVSNDSGCEGRDPPSSSPAPTADIDSQVLVASAATPRAGGRYNLRSRAPGATATPSTEGLTKPLLADAAGFEGSGGSDHGHHSHNGHHHHHAHGGSLQGGHGGHAGHVPHHHHSVVTGDLKQGVVLLVAMSVHTFLECMALGLMVSRRLC